MVGTVEIECYCTSWWGNSCRPFFHHTVNAGTGIKIKRQTRKTAPHTTPIASGLEKENTQNHWR